MPVGTPTSRPCSLFSNSVTSSFGRAPSTRHVRRVAGSPPSGRTARSVWRPDAASRHRDPCDPRIPECGGRWCAAGRGYGPSGAGTTCMAASSAEAAAPSMPMSNAIMSFSSSS